MLCEPSGYVWNELVYCRKMDPMPGFGHIKKVVLDGKAPWSWSCNVDNFYTSVPLSEELFSQKTLLCGTVRKNRKHLPKSVVSTKLKKGKYIGKQNGRIVVEKWNDMRDVLILTTCHSGRMVASNKPTRQGEIKKKPDAVIAYNKYMYKTIKWYRKVVLQHLDDDGKCLHFI